MLFLDILGFFFIQSTENLYEFRAVYITGVDTECFFVC